MIYFLLSFAKVEANLLYIQEEELKPEFQNKLCLLNKTNKPLFIIVQLKLTPLGFEPMINNLRDIRMQKAQRKISNWIRVCYALHPRLVVKIIDEIPQKDRPYLDFSGINRLSVYHSKGNEERIVPYLMNYFSSEKLSLKYFSSLK